MTDTYNTAAWRCPACDRETDIDPRYLAERARLVQAEQEGIALVQMSSGEAIPGDDGYQELHDAMQALVMAASQVQQVIVGDFPEVCTRIAEYVAEGEYAEDPIAQLIAARVHCAALCREMERG